MTWNLSRELWMHLASLGTVILKQPQTDCRGINSHLSESPSTHTAYHTHPISSLPQDASSHSTRVRRTIILVKTAVMCWSCLFSLSSGSSCSGRRQPGLGLALFGGAGTKAGGESGRSEKEKNPRCEDSHSFPGKDWGQEETKERKAAVGSWLKLCHAGQDI